MVQVTERIPEQRSEDFPGLVHMQQGQRYAVHCLYQFSPHSQVRVVLTKKPAGQPDATFYTAYCEMIFKPQPQPSGPYEIGTLCMFVYWAKNRGFDIQIFAEWDPEHEKPGNSSREYKFVSTLIAQTPAPVNGDQAIYAMIEEGRKLDR